VRELLHWSYEESGDASTRRDMRLDLLRGFCVVVMVADHIGGEQSWLYIMTGGNRFFTSAAEGFVLISGIVMGTVAETTLRREGKEAVSARQGYGPRPGGAERASQSTTAAPAASAAPAIAHSLRPVMNDPGSAPMPWKIQIAPTASRAMQTPRRTPRMR